jgi:hypothetical protein
MISVLNDVLWNENEQPMFQEVTPAIDRQVPPSAYSGIGGVKGHNINDITLPGSPAVPVPS